MGALVVTDHVYLRHSTAVYDTYCFDYQFFADYLTVFPSVKVVCRIAQVERLPPGAFRSDGERVEFLGVPPLRGALWPLASRIVASGTLWRAAGEADAVIARVPSELGWLAAKAARAYGKPFMVELIGDPRLALLGVDHTLSYRLAARLWHRRTRAMARSAAAVSYVNRSHLPNAYPAPPGVPCDVISSIRLRQADLVGPRTFAGPATPIRLVHVGTLTPRKRVQDLVRACSLANVAGTLAELHIVGDGPERARLEALVAGLQINERVHFHGHVAGRSAVNGFMDASDLFVLVSASEGLPRAVLEAMARGLPVIAARTPGVDELVSMTESFPVGDIANLTALICDLARTPTRLSELSRRSLRVAAEYTADHLSPRRVALYRELAARATGPTAAVGNSG